MALTQPIDRTLEFIIYRKGTAAIDLYVYSSDLPTLLSKNYDKRFYAPTG